MNKKVKVGVFGVGSLGQHHARIYAESSEVDLVGLYDIDRTRCEEVSARHGIRPFTDIESLAREIEACSIAVPTDKHFEMFSKLAESNLHMLMEKPIASSLEEAEAMVKKAQEKKILLQVGHVERFNPVMKFLEENLSHPRFIEAIRLAPYPPPRKDALPRGTEVSVVLDMMIHDLDIILHIVNSKVKDVRAVGVPVLSKSEDIANVRLAFENGCVANVSASRISAERLRKIRVFQEDAYLSLDYMNQTGQIHRKTRKNIETKSVPIEKGDALTAELTSFIHCVRDRNNPVVTGEHAFEALNLAIEICRITQENPS